MEAVPAPTLPPMTLEIAEVVPVSTAPPMKRNDSESSDGFNEFLNIVSSMPVVVSLL